MIGSIFGKIFIAPIVSSLNLGGIYWAISAIIGILGPFGTLVPRSSCYDKKWVLRIGGPPITRGIFARLFSKWGLFCRDIDHYAVRGIKKLPVGTILAKNAISEFGVKNNPANTCCCIWWQFKFPSKHCSYAVNLSFELRKIDLSLNDRNILSQTKNLFTSS